MTPRLTAIRTDVVAVRWRHPFVTALGRRERVTQNLVVRLVLSNGLVGYGEGSSSLAMPTQTAAALAAAIGRVRDALIGQPIRRYRALTPPLWQREGAHPTALAALEMALCDGWARTRGQPLYRLFGGRRTFVESDLTLSAWPAARAARVARAAWQRGFRRFKIKVGTRDLDADLRRVVGVARAVPRAGVLLDANQGWTVRQTLQVVRTLARHRVIPRLIEQPVPRAATAALREVTRRSPVPVIVDETAHTADDVRRIIRRRLAGGINIKLAKSGIWGALEMMRLARRAGLHLMIGCMAESSIGLAASVHLACGVGRFDDVDLDTPWLLHPLARCRGGFTARGPRLWVGHIRSGTGLQWMGGGC